jgi:hypothetical protein
LPSAVSAIIALWTVPSVSKGTTFTSSALAHDAAQ